jgi:hypothetical protein
MMPYCSCAEIKNSQGKDVDSVPEWHNCEYISQRNSLIPKAMDKATAESTTESGVMDQAKFTYLFSVYMDQAAKEAGIV